MTDVVYNEEVDTTFKVNLDSFDGKTKYQRRQINVYTDCSEIDGKVGLGLIYTKEMKSSCTSALDYPTGLQSFRQK